MQANTFKVLISQEGDAQPTIIQLGNSTGSFNPTIERETVGVFICRHPEIGFGKSAVTFGPGLEGSVITVEPIRPQSNVLRFKTVDGKTGKPIDGKMKDTFLQVEFYRHLL